MELIFPTEHGNGELSWMEIFIYLMHPDNGNPLSTTWPIG